MGEREQREKGGREATVKAGPIKSQTCTPRPGLHYTGRGRGALLLHRRHVAVQGADVGLQRPVLLAVPKAQSLDVLQLARTTDAVASPGADAVSDFALDVLHVQQRVELGQLRQAVERLVRVAEVEGGVGPIRVVEEVKVAELFLLLCHAWHACKGQRPASLSQCTRLFPTFTETSPIT